MKITLLEYLNERIGETRACAILSYLKEQDCSLKICKPRKSKLGDFRIKGKLLSIKVNDMPNPYRFTLTLIHEIAHLKTYREFGLKLKPHGAEWKKNYAQLLLIWNIEELFSESQELLLVYNSELQNPKACSGIHQHAEKTLRTYDNLENHHCLDELPDGQKFLFRNVPYERLSKRRTRVLCLNLLNHRRYTIHKSSAVELI